MKDRAVASAPGKIILFGEHFVVSGYPAVVTAINMRARVTVTPAKNSIEIISGRSHVKWGEEELQANGESLVRSPYDPLVSMALKLMDDYGVKAYFKAEITSTIPSAAGLGSSAAVSVAFAKALASFLDLDISVEKVIEYSMFAEKTFHGRPSGIDSHVAALGGTLLYSGPKKASKLSLDKKPDIALVFTGIKRRTSSLVSHVQTTAEKEPDFFKGLAELYSQVLGEGVDALRSSDLKSLGRLMSLNHFLLRCLGLSNVVVERAVEMLLESGFYGAKLTGAGGGGCVIAVGEKEVERSLNYVRELFPDTWLVNMGCEGVVEEY